MNSLAGRHLGARTSGGLVYKDYAFPDGYTFRQYRDRSILILKSPVSGGGILLYPHVPETKAAWQAITDRIRDYKSGKVRDFTSVGLLALQTILANLQPPRKRAGGRASVPPPVVVEPPPAAGFPWVPVAIGSAVLVVILAVATRDKA